MFRKFIKVIVNLLLILVIAAGLALFVPPFFGISTEVAKQGMDTNLMVGTVAYTQDTDIARIQSGDDILQVEDAYSVYLYTVKSVDIKNNTAEVTLKGGSETQTVDVESTVRKTILTVPYIGYVLIAMSTTDGQIVLGLIVLLLIALFILVEVWCKRAADEEDEDEEEEEEETFYEELSRKKAEADAEKEAEFRSRQIEAETQKDDPAEEEAAPDESEPELFVETLEEPEETLDPEPEAEMIHPADLEFSGTAPEETQILSDEKPSEPELPETGAEEKPETAGLSRETAADTLTGTEEEEPTREIPAAEILAEELEKTREISREELRNQGAEETAQSAADTFAAEIEKLRQGDAEDGARETARREEEFRGQLQEKEQIPNVQAALEAALETQPIRRYEQDPAPQPEMTEEPQADELDEIELAMPARTVDELLQTAYASGHDPKVTKDEATGVTLVDFSDCL